MRIVAALPWYDEPPAHLDRCVRSLAGVVDYLVALDGRWEHFADDDPVLSHWTQAQAIARAADAIGLDHEVCMGGRAWGSQVEKRAALMALASEQGDWVFVIDADEYVVSYSPRLRAELEATELNVALVRLNDLTRRRAPSKIRRVYRRGTTVKTAHNGYNLAGEWLHGDTAHVRLATPLDCSAWLELHDAHGDRSEAELERKREYSRARREHRLEAWR